MHYTFIEGSSYFNPDAEYGRSLIDSPHKLAMTPTVQLPFGEGRRFFNESKRRQRDSRQLDDRRGDPDAERLPDRRQPEHQQHQPARRQPAAEHRAGPGRSCVGGSITDRLRDNPDDDRYLNEAAFIAAPAGTFGNAPRILPGAYSPWRNSTDVAINKDIRFGGGKRATLRLRDHQPVRQPVVRGDDERRVRQHELRHASNRRGTTRGRCRSRRGLVSRGEGQEGRNRTASEPQRPQRAETQFSEPLRL